MKQHAGVLVLSLVTVAIGTAYMQASGRPADEPIWAYGFLAPPSLAEKHHWPRTPDAQPPAERRSRRPGAPAPRPGLQRGISLVDIRDGHNVIDWFPGDHPSPMPDVIAHGPKKLGATSRGCGSCHLPNGQGRSENAASPAGCRTHTSFVSFRISAWGSGAARTGARRTRRRWSTSRWR